MASVMYWRPFKRYVIGDPDCGAGMKTAPTSLPVALSYARSIAPRAPDGVVAKPASPAITTVLVVSTPMIPERPVRGIFRPLSAGLFLMLSGVSPCGTCHTISPLSRLIAQLRPYGGLPSGKPCMLVAPPPPPPSPPPPAAAASPPPPRPPAAP